MKKDRMVKLRADAVEALAQSAAGCTKLLGGTVAKSVVLRVALRDFASRVEAATTNAAVTALTMDIARASLRQESAATKPRTVAKSPAARLNAGNVAEFDGAIPWEDR